MVLFSTGQRALEETSSNTVTKRSSHLFLVWHFYRSPTIGGRAFCPAHSFLPLIMQPMCKVGKQTNPLHIHCVYLHQTGRVTTREPLQKATLIGMSLQNSAIANSIATGINQNFYLDLFYLEISGKCSHLLGELMAHVVPPPRTKTIQLSFKRTPLCASTVNQQKEEQFHTNNYLFKRNIASLTSSPD